jgi:hypothetical protein
MKMSRELHETTISAWLLTYTRYSEMLILQIFCINPQEDIQSQGGLHNCSGKNREGVF